MQVYDATKPVLEQLQLEANMCRMQPFVFSKLNYGVSVQVGWSKHCAYVDDSGRELSAPDWDFTYTQMPNDPFPVNRSTRCEISVFQIVPKPVESVDHGDYLMRTLARYEAIDAVVKADLRAILSDYPDLRILSKWHSGGISYLGVDECTELLNAFDTENKKMNK